MAFTRGWTHPCVDPHSLLPSQVSWELRGRVRVQAITKSPQINMVPLDGHGPVLRNSCHMSSAGLDHSLNICDHGQWGANNPGHSKEQTVPGTQLDDGFLFKLGFWLLPLGQLP